MLDIRNGQLLAYDFDKFGVLLEPLCDIQNFGGKCCGEEQCLMLLRNFRQNGVEITPEQWTVLLFLWEKDGVTQQELCNATFKDKPSMTRLIDNMERQHLVVRIADKRDRRTNLIHLTKTGRELEGKARFIANKTLKEALQGLTLEELKVSQDVLRKVFTNIKD